MRSCLLSGASRRIERKVKQILHSTFGYVQDDDLLRIDVRCRCHDWDAFKGAEHQEILVSRDEKVCTGADGAFQKHIVFGIPAGFDCSAKLHVNCAREDGIESRKHTGRLPTELLRENAIDLFFHLRASGDHIAAHC